MRKRFVLGLLGGAILSLAVLGLYWLAILSLVLVLCLFTLKKALVRVASMPLRRGLSAVLLVFGLMVTTALFKVVVVGPFRIPSGSMQKTLYTGDVVLVNKLAFGPRLPRSPFEIPWLNIAFYFNDKARSRIKEKWWDYRRLPGMDSVRRGEMYVSETNFGYVAKRCVALPGDTLEVRGGALRVNGRSFEPSEAVRSRYGFRVRDNEGFQSFIKQKAVRLKPNDQGLYRPVLEKGFADALINSGVVDSLRILPSQHKKSNLYGPLSPWTFSDYGPYIVPKKGCRIELTPFNFSCYGRLIKDYEGAKIVRRGDGFWLRGEQVTHYNFHRDYYFMMGDNRVWTVDSRGWGPLPECNLVGRIDMVLWSSWEGEFHWERFMKFVD
ncbi:hypothetical protein FUAX_29320 [Fulvitalea axinellae]|uniref:Signal peptidase I n=1 Tax=Fulvitalea axinellae TaxID=1182444 RepID=A0AAU9DDG8_9BACT|nr:hypothetical protein FUAX_29320 [Fulvitalea axinellae]